jgi:hypothetical protein
MDFISSSSFQGIKFGYIYKNGRNGIGYYIDKKNNYRSSYEMTKISSHVDDSNSNYSKYHSKKIRCYFLNKDNDKNIDRYKWPPVLIVSNTAIVYIYICMYIHMHIYIHIYIHISIYMYIVVIYTIHIYLCV